MNINIDVESQITVVHLLYVTEIKKSLEICSPNSLFEQLSYYNERFNNYLFFVILRFVFIVFFSFGFSTFFDSLRSSSRLMVFLCFSVKS